MLLDGSFRIREAGRLKGNEDKVKQCTMSSLHSVGTPRQTLHFESFHKLKFSKSILAHTALSCSLMSAGKRCFDHVCEKSVYAM